MPCVLATSHSHAYDTHVSLYVWACVRRRQMNAMRREPRAVLVLLSSDSLVRQRLTREAMAAGVHPSRLVFAARATQVGDAGVCVCGTCGRAGNTARYGGVFSSLACTCATVHAARGGRWSISPATSPWTCSWTRCSTAPTRPPLTHCSWACPSCRCLVSVGACARVCVHECRCEARRQSFWCETVLTFGRTRADAEQATTSRRAWQPV